MIRQRRRTGRLSWVHEHLQITILHSVDRVPLPDKGEHAARRGRKATGQRWSLIAGLPKESNTKGKRLWQFIPGKLS